MVEYHSIEDLKTICNNLHAQNIFLVCGQTSFEKSGAKAKLERFIESFNVTQFSDYTENPKLEDAIKGVNLFKQSNAKLIIAVGGGTTIDIAKLVKILSANPEAATSILNNNVSDLSLDTPLIVAPTTAGTGSDATHFAVVYYEGKKYSVAHAALLPDYVILEPSLTFSMPPYLTACSGMDALSQAIESYWNVNSTKESRFYAKQAMNLILANLSEAVHQPTKVARTQMLKAAFLAGKAINITKTTAPHALSYRLTSKYGIAHGHAVALFLPSFLKYNYGVTNDDCNDNRGVEFVKNSLLEISEFMGEKNIVQAVKFLEQFIFSLGLQTRLSDFNIRNDEIHEIVGSINLERLKNNPRNPTLNNLHDIVIKVF